MKKSSAQKRAALFAVLTANNMRNRARRELNAARDLHEDLGATLVVASVDDLCSACRERKMAIGHERAAKVFAFIEECEAAIECDPYTLMD